MHNKSRKKRIPPRYIQRAVSVLLALVFIFSAAMTGTLAWGSFNQESLNMVRYKYNAVPGEPVGLVKLDKDTGEPIEGAEFYLYTSDDEQIGGRYVTGSGGKIDVKLPPGDYYFLETHPSSHYTYDKAIGNAQCTMHNFGDDIKCYHFTVTGNETETIEVLAYNVHITGGLIIEKTVKAIDNGQLTIDSLNKKFEFTVTFEGMDDGPITFKIDNEEKTLSIVNSQLSIELKHGQKAIFEDLPAGVTYTVAEKPVFGYTTTSDDHQGTITKDGSIASFVNTYGGPGSLTVTKTTTGGGSGLNKQFSFTAVIDGITYTFTLKNGESKTFENLPVGAAYTVTEGDYTADGYISAPASYAGNTIDGELILPFVNVRDDKSGDPGHLEISKTVINPGGAALTNEQKAVKFAFTVTFDNLPAAPVDILVNGDPAQVSADDNVLTFELSHGESVLIENLPAGTTYEVVETPHPDYIAGVTAADGEIISNHTAQAGFVNQKEKEPEFTSLIIKKEVTGEVPAKDANLEYHFILEVEGMADRDVYIKAGQSETITGLPVGAAYTVREAVPNGYALIGVTSGSGTLTVATITATFKNRYDDRIMTDIGGEKTWVCPAGTELPESVIIRLMDGTTVVDTVTVTPGPDGKWTYSFEDIPKYRPDGVTLIVYTVVEEPITSWRPAYDPDSYDIINTYIPPAVNDSIPVEKTVSGGTPEQDARFTFILTALDGAPMPNGSAGVVKTVNVTGEGTNDFGSITYTAPGTYVYTIAEMNTSAEGYAYDESVYTLTIVVEEQNDALVITSKTLTKNGSPADKALFVNDYNPGLTNIRVTKQWQGTAPHPASVQVQLFKDGTAHGEPVTLNAANSWTHLYTGLDKDAVWTADEPNVPDGYNKTVSGDAVNGFTITNSKDTLPDTTSVSVRKVWDDNNNPNRPQSVTVQLYKDGTAHGSAVTLNAANNWQYTWANLEKGPVYTVDETVVPAGYFKTVTGNADTGYIITNGKNPVPPDMVEIRGAKTWNPTGLKKEYYPTSITILVKVDGVVVAQKLVTEDDHWIWIFRLPKYDDHGGEIDYEIDEVKMIGFIKTVTGYDVKNVFDPTDPDVPYTWLEDDPTPKDPGDGPKTGDDSNMALWFTLMVSSMLGLIATAVIGKKTKKRYAYEAKYVRKT